ncbi:MAG: Gfo/Idh/MocA family oxidoreductase [Planctomycetota bacterium]
MLTRREFSKGTALAAFAMGAPVPAPRRRRRSPGDEIRVAVAGIRSRGVAHINGFHRIEGVRVVALCDVDQQVLAREAKKFEDRDEKVDTEVDFRRLLDREDIDVMSFATPNHWHALQAVWSCQAGKDVYLEKPVSHNVWEGGQIVKAARAHGRLVQTGTQARSSHGIAEAMEWLQAGNLGEVQVARGLCYKPRQSIGKVDAEQQVPEHVDYDLWTGPAPMKPLGRRRLHYDWHWVFDTGNGDVGNQGIHQMDIARWALGKSELPRATFSIGGRLGYDDDGNTPNTQVVVHDYGQDEPKLVFEVRGLPREESLRSDGWGGGEMDRFLGARIGVIVHCKDGIMRFPNYSSAQAVSHDGEEIAAWNGAKDHFANFIDAVRSRKVEDLASDIREGHLSSAMCHMGNVSHLLGRPASAEEIGREIDGRAAAAESYGRMLAHLEANGIDLASTPLTLGPNLKMDPSTERFVDNEDAQRLAAREYRAPFEVPKEV